MVFFPLREVPLLVALGTSRHPPRREGLPLFGNVCVGSNVSSTPAPRSYPLRFFTTNVDPVEPPPPLPLGSPRRFVHRASLLAPSVPPPSPMPTPVLEFRPLPFHAARHGLLLPGVLACSPGRQPLDRSENPSVSFHNSWINPFFCSPVFQLTGADRGFGRILS